MQKFDTTAPVNAVLDIAAGRIHLIAADRSDATVQVLPADAGKSRDVKAAEQIEVGYADGVLSVRYPEAKNRLLGSSGAVEVTVQLPAGSSVEAKAAAAEFRGAGPLGDVAFDGGQGAVEIEAAASVRLTAFDSDVTVGRLTGSGEISTHKGDVTVNEAAAGVLTLDTLAGNVTVGAAHGVSAALDAGTASGRITNTLKNTDGTPALTIRATTNKGDITARSL
ncbi:DUF4097 family beta strand repeat-containing protein [Streptomyces sp. NPDC050085]|uniref:DUF4097 family beta strand repeat-containing protein n=1 Tax=Streptomyces sp. NPDC050085 TaxID=3365600 RepID=UPI003795D836